MFDCPFCCGFATTSSYQIQLHVEEQHIAGSGFATKDDESLTLALQLQQEEEDALQGQKLDGASRSLALSLQRESSADTASQTSSNGNNENEDIPYFECPRPGCGEFVHLIDFNEHLDLHASSDPSLEADLPNTITNEMLKSVGYTKAPHHSLQTADRINNQDSLLDNTNRAADQRSYPKDIKIPRAITPFLQERSRKKSRPKSPATKVTEVGRLGVSFEQRDCVHTLYTSVRA